MQRSISHKLAGILGMALVMMLIGVPIPLVNADTTYEVSVSWFGAASPMPASGNCDFIISFNPAVSSTGLVDMQTLTGFTRWTTLPRYDYNASLGSLAVLFATMGPDGSFDFVTTGWPNNVIFDHAAFLPDSSVPPPIRTYTGTATATVVPVPPSAFLLGSGLLGLAGWRRLRKS
jgi:hypothetical protein